MKKYILLYFISFNIFALQILEGPDILSENSHTKIINLARSGDAQSQFKLANMYYAGDGVEKNDELSFYWYKEVAQNDYPSAQFNVANSYYKGIGTTKDTEKAIEWYSKAADAGLVAAMYNLAFIFKDDKKDLPTSFSWFLKAANFGNSASQMIVADAYARGVGVEKNAVEATKWFELAVQSDTDNILDSKYSFAKFLTEQKEDEKALALYEQSANSGSVLAQYDLANIYFAGKTVKQDQKKATQLLTQAATGEHSAAQELLASKYYRQKLYDKALHWYQKAVNNNNAKAQYSLGVMYLKGLGVEQDIYKSTELFIKSAEQNYVNAQYSLAVRYLKGDGIAQNYYEAVKWLKRAAKNEHVNAQYSLSLRYKNGEGVEADKKQRIFWLQQASKNNNKTAMYELSALTLLGEKTDVKKEDAVKNLQKLTSDKNLTGGANYALGKFFLQSKSDVATVHLEKSSKAGYAPAIKLVKTLTTSVVADKKPVVQTSKATSESTDETTATASKATKTTTTAATKPVVQTTIVETIVKKPVVQKPKLATTQPVTKNTIPASRTHPIAVNTQEVQSMYRLAIMYLNNSRTPQDFRSAFMLMEQVSLQEFPPAQNDIALMYLNGLGVTTDIKKAYHFGNLAFNSGYLPAGQTLILIKNAANKTYQP